MDSADRSSESTAGGSDPDRSESALARAIVELVRATHEKVFLRIFRKVGNEATARELTGDTLARVWEKRHQFDQAQSGEAWVMTIAENIVIDHRRSAGAKKRKAPTVSFDQLFAKLNDENNQQGTRDLVDLKSINPSEKTLRLDSIDEMKRASSDLSDKDRQLYQLRLEDLSLDEIAARTGQSKNAVGSALTRMYAKLRSKLSND